MKLLEAVAEAAEELDRLFNSGCPYLSQARNKLHQAILAWRKVRTHAAGCVSAAPTGCVSDTECAAAGRCLERPDALPAQPAGETVTLWEDASDGECRMYREGSKGARWVQRDNWTRLGTVTLEVTP